MVFNKNVDKNEIEKFENDCLKKVSIFSLISFLKEELIKRKWSFKLEIQHKDIQQHCGACISLYHSPMDSSCFVWRNN